MTPKKTGLVLRSHRSGSTLATFCVVVILFSGCAKEEPRRQSPATISSQSRFDDSATESVQPGSANPSGSPVNEPAPSQSPSRDPARLHQEALLALEAGDEEVAFDLGHQAMRLAPDDPQVVFLMAMILGKRNRFPEAIQMLDELAETTPAVRLPVMGQTADWMVRFGQWSKAEDRYLAILNEVPGSALAHRNLAQLMVRQGRRIEAAEHLGQLCRLGDIQERELRTLLSIVHPFVGDAEKEDFDPIGVLGVARNEIAKEDWQGARERLEKLDALEPQESALLGRVYATIGDYEALQRWTSTELDSTQRHPDAWFAHGAHEVQRGDHAAAIRCFAEAVLRDQTDHDAYAWMSRSLQALGMTQPAEQASSRAESIKQTQLLGAEMAATTNRDLEKMSSLISLLDQLHRPLEALAWRGVKLAYEPTASEQVVQESLDEVMTQRSELLKTNLGQASKSFLLCGVDLDALSMPSQP